MKIFFAFNYVIALIFLVLVTGIFVASIKAARNEKITYKDFIPNLPEIRGYWIGTFLVSLAGILSELVFAILGVICYFSFIENSNNYILAFFLFPFAATLFSIPVIYILIKFAMTFYYLLVEAMDSGDVSISWGNTVDTFKKGITAMKRSNSVMKNRIWEYIGLMLVSSLILVAGILCFGVGILFAFPVVFIAEMRYFLDINGELKNGEFNRNIISENIVVPLPENNNNESNDFSNMN